MFSAFCTGEAGTGQSSLDSDCDTWQFLTLDLLTETYTLLLLISPGLLPAAHQEKRETEGAADVNINRVT